MDGGTNRPKVLISRQETKGKAARTVVIVLSVGARKKKQIRATTSPPFATRVRRTLIVRVLEVVAFSPIKIYLLSKNWGLQSRHYKVGHRNGIKLEIHLWKEPLFHKTLSPSSTCREKVYLKMQRAPLGLLYIFIGRKERVGRSFKFEICLRRSWRASGNFSKWPHKPVTAPFN